MAKAQGGVRPRPSCKMAISAMAGPHRRDALRDPPIQLQLLVSFLVFLFPLALYCLFLAYINRGRHPFVVSGVWDSVGLVLALSGFLLYTLPRAILWPLSVLLVGSIPGGDDPLLAGTRGLVLGIAYYALPICAVGVLLLVRRHNTVLYTVQTAVALSGHAA